MAHSINGNVKLPVCLPVRSVLGNGPAWIEFRSEDHTDQQIRIQFLLDTEWRKTIRVAHDSPLLAEAGRDSGGLGTTPSRVPLQARSLPGLTHLPVGITAGSLAVMEAEALSGREQPRTILCPRARPSLSLLHLPALAVTRRQHAQRLTCAARSQWLVLRFLFQQNPRSRRKVPKARQRESVLPTLWMKTALKWTSPSWCTSNRAKCPPPLHRLSRRQWDPVRCQCPHCSSNKPRHFL